AGERLPADARLRDGLVGASFIHAPPRQAQLRACGVRLLDECFFCGGIRILDLNHHSATRATPLGYTGVAPAPIALPTQTGLVQDAPDGVGADKGQSVRGAVQCALQGCQRPGGGPVALPIRGSVELMQDAYLGRRVVQAAWPA